MVLTHSHLRSPRIEWPPGVPSLQRGTRSSASQPAEKGRENWMFHGPPRGGYGEGGLSLIKPLIRPIKVLSLAPPEDSTNVEPVRFDNAWPGDEVERKRLCEAHKNLTPQYCGWTKSYTTQETQRNESISLQTPTNSGLPWFQSGAGFSPSTVCHSLKSSQIEVTTNSP